MCVGCRRRAPAEDMVRVSVDAGGLRIGVPGGRGAWVGPECFTTVAATQLSRALRAPVTPAQVDALHTALAGRGRIDVRHT